MTLSTAWRMYRSPLYALTMTFAAVDWAMAREPYWFSHMYGVIVIGGQMLTAIVIPRVGRPIIFSCVGKQCQFSHAT